MVGEEGRERGASPFKEGDARKIAKPNSDSESPEAVLERLQKARAELSEAERSKTEASDWMQDLKAELKALVEKRDLLVRIMSEDSMRANVGRKNALDETNSELELFQEKMSTAKRNFKEASDKAKQWKSLVEGERMLLKKAQARQQPEQAQRRSRLVERKREGNHIKKTKHVKKKIRRSEHMGTPVKGTDTPSEISEVESSEDGSSPTPE